MKRSGFGVVAVLALFLASACSAVRGGGERRTDWEVAYDLSGNPTKIRYSFGLISDGGVSVNHAVYLFNGYDKPLKIHYKVYFSARTPYFGDQSVYNGREAFAVGMGGFQPERVVIMGMEEE